MEHRDEGVVLQATPFQDHHHIITLFSATNGLIKLFARGKKLPAIVSPLSRIEFIYTSKANKLGQLKNASVLDSHHNLRDDFATLEASCQIAQSLLLTQMQGKPAPHLYRLFLSYLKQGSSNPAYVSSFHLKLLKHEGLLHLHKNCAHCGSSLSSAHIDIADAFCKDHAPAHSLHFTEEERASLLYLVSSRSLKEILSFEITPSLKNRVRELLNRLSACSSPNVS